MFQKINWNKSHITESSLIGFACIIFELFNVRREPLKSKTFSWSIIWKFKHWTTKSAKFKPLKLMSFNDDKLCCFSQSTKGNFQVSVGNFNVLQAASKTILGKERNLIETKEMNSCFVSEKWRYTHFTKCMLLISLVSCSYVASLSTLLPTKSTNLPILIFTSFMCHKIIECRSFLLQCLPARAWPWVWPRFTALRQLDCQSFLFC